MKVYKTIFRLDYPLSYGLVDGLGHRLEFLMTNSQNKAPFTEVGGALNLGQQYSLVHHGHYGEHNRFSTTLGPKTFNSNIEHYKGCDLQELHSNALFKLCDKLIADKAILSEESRFDRIGIRLWIIATDPKFTKPNILKYLCAKNDYASSVLKSESFNSDDIAITFESKHDDGTQVRVSIGPYSKVEIPKYFTLMVNPEVEVEEGLMFDIDISDYKIKVPGFNLSTFSRHKIRTIQSICEKTIESFKKELSL